MKVSKLGFFSDTLQVEIPAGATNLQLDFTLQPENAFLALDIDSVKTVAPANSVSEQRFTLSNTGTGTLRFSIRDVNGPGRAVATNFGPPPFGKHLAQLLQNRPPMTAPPSASPAVRGAKELVPIISDPSGDAVGGQQPDLVGVFAEKAENLLTIKMKFSHAVDPDSLVASLAMDTDQNPETGSPSIGIFLNDIGPEYDVILTVPALPAVGIPAAAVVIFDNSAGGPPILLPNAVEVGADSAISATIDLSALGGDDGNINVVAGAYHFGRGINNTPSSFDAAPDEGHGTIGIDANADAVWLSAAPASGAIAGMGSQEVTVTFNTTGLKVQSYSALLLISTNDPNNAERAVPVKLLVTPPVGVAEESEVPLEFALHQNRPNPFRTATQIEYTLPAPQAVELKIYNLQGQLLHTLFAGQQPSGRHVTQWHGRDQHGVLVANGVYFYVLSAGRQQITRKLLIMR